MDGESVIALTRIIIIQMIIWSNAPFLWLLIMNRMCEDGKHEQKMRLWTFQNLKIIARVARQNNKLTKIEKCEN